VASAFITRRRTKTGTSYVVRYRLGGRAYPIQHGGAFGRERDAKTRLGMVQGELAAGRDPAVALRTIAIPETRRTFRQVAEAYRASKVNLAETTTENNQAHYKALAVFADRDPATITFADVQAWVNALALAPSSVRVYINTLRQILDYAAVDPNPARDRRVNLPRLEKEEPNPPTARQFLAILDAVPARWRLPLALLEQTGMRIGEAGKLTWGDVNTAEASLRLPRKRTKTRRARWVQVPSWLMETLEATLPLEDRTADRRVFQGFTDDAARGAMARACKLAGTGHFHPHDLRHRRISLWGGQGIPWKHIADRVGHMKPSETADTYSHVLMDEAEITAEEFLALLGEGG
jgi:integrase